MSGHFEAKIADFGLTLIADRLDDSGYDDYQSSAEDHQGIKYIYNSIGLYVQ